MKTTLLAMLLLAPCSLAQVRHLQPSAQARRAGSRLPWLSSHAEAVALAGKTRKKVFWYVPTVPRSPMDRKPVIDLFMRAGFFSDPDLAELLREFVLLDLVPSRKLARKYRLLPFRFIEPGFLILDRTGKELCRAHAVTTFHPRWFAARLRPYLPAAFFERPAPPDRESAQAFRIRRFRLFGLEKGEVPERAGSAELAAQLALRALAGAKPGRALELCPAGSGDARLGFLRGAATWLLGRHAKAREIWMALAKAQPDEPLAWRAAAEAEGFGPFARGFWIWRDLPDTDPARWVMESWPGSTLRRDSGELPMLRRRSVEFLLSRQGQKGGWEDSNYDFGGLDSLPNVHVAVTTLCCRALLKHRELRPLACDMAVARGLRYVLDPQNRNPEDKDEWIWARIYPIHLLAELLDEPGNGASIDIPPARLKVALQELVQDSLSRQAEDGSIRHEYRNPFTTAALLLALKAAEQRGVAVPEDRIERALASLERCRNKLGAFSYRQVRSESSVRSSPRGAAGRMPLCEAALFAWQRSDEQRMARALDAAFTHHDELERSRKYDDHAGRFGYGGFFYWYDMLGRQMAFELLGPRADGWRQKQLEIILATPEIDGCFVDSHELGRSYGTAMALLCLDDCM